MKFKQNEMLKTKLYFHTKEIDEKNFTLTGVLSTGETDRHNEVIDQNGWDTKEYMLNPVVLFAHDQYQPAVGQMLKLYKNADGDLEGVIKFAAEEYDFAMTLFKLYAGRYMRAFSVGFQNNKYEVDEETDIITLKENTLFELSCVNVPANAMALAKSAGVNVEPLQKIMKKIFESKTGKEFEKSVKTLTKTIDKVNHKQNKIITALKGQSKDNARTDKTKVETPASEGDKKGNSVSHINKLIRNLQKQKKNIKNKTK